uniref:Ig-like domain-containing protein n=1 Tax=Biomphalaria glabrata TaxID=6526 RepID=A0A2C9LJN7_BIOGL
MLCPIAVVCSVLLLSLDHVRSEELCPSALEGSQYNLSCTGSALGYRLNTDRFIKWIEKDSSSGEEREITLCVWYEACETNYKSEFSVTNSILGQSFTSLLTFHKVTDKHRDKTLVCQLWYSNTTVRSCKMAVFQPGSNTGCTANLNKDGKIDLLCFSDDVYPGISCQYSEYINSLPSRLNQTMSKSSQKMNGKNLYSSKCETTLFPLVKGSYEYRFIVMLDYQIQGLWNFTSKNSVKVAKSPKVDIDQVETAPSLCPGVSSVRVVCSVNDWFGTKPLFRFSLLGKTLNSEETSQNGYKYKMTYNVPIKEGNFKALMNCTVGYYDSGGAFRGVWDTKHLNFSYPPKPPVFTNTALPTLSQILDITQGQNMTIECQALDGFPKVSFINVTCMSKGRVIYTNVTNSNRLPVIGSWRDTRWGERRSSSRCQPRGASVTVARRVTSVHPVVVIVQLSAMFADEYTGP